MNEEIEDKGEHRGSIRGLSATMSESPGSQEGLHRHAAGDARSKSPPPLLPSASASAVTASPSTSISTTTAVPAHLARADSGASSASSSSSAGSCDSYGAPSTTLSCSSAPSSLFSSSDTGDRRGSFASSVWESEGEESHRDKEQEDDDDVVDAANTPSAAPAPLRASIARTVSDSGSSVASESASSDSASTSTAANMATPTVELGQLHLFPSSSNSSSSITAASPSHAAGLSSPSSASPVYAAARVRPLVTSPDMLRYAQRVTAMGTQYGHFPAGHRKSATASPGVSTPSSASSSSTVRPSLSHSASSSTASSEGFPWTARPSTGQPTSSSHRYGSNHYHSTDTSSRPSTSSSVYADIRPCWTRMTSSSSSLVATPSAIFSASLNEADDDEAPATYASVRNASPQPSRSRSESQHSSSIATNVGSLQNGTHRQSAAPASGAMTASSSAETTTTTIHEDDDAARTQQGPSVAATSPSSSLQSTSRDPSAYAHSSRGPSQSTPQRPHQDRDKQQHPLPRSSDTDSPRRSATSPFTFEAPQEAAMAAAALAHLGTAAAPLPARTSPTHHHMRPLQQQQNHVQQYQARYSSSSSNSKTRAVGGDAAAILPPIGGPSSIEGAVESTTSPSPSLAFSLDSFTMSPTYGGTASQASTFRGAAAQISRARNPSVDSHNTTASIGSGSLYTSSSGHSSGNWSAYSGSTALSSIGGGTSSSNSSVRDSSSGLNCQLGSHGSIAGILAQSSGPPGQHASTTRPSTSSSTLSSGTRPWVKDSDAASVKSSSGLSSEGSCDSSEKEPSVMSPAAPPPVPFLSTGPSPAGCKIQVDTSNPDHFDVIVTLPGFSLENITLALKRNGSLHILADKYDDIASLAMEGDDAHGGHFERMVELGETAIGAKVTAEFDGKRLKVMVKKRDSGPKQTTSRPRHHHSSLDLLAHR